jgi:hypothetical protein
MLTGNLISSNVKQIENSGISKLQDVSEVINLNANPFEGEQYGKIVTVTTSESIVNENSPATSGINVISSTITPLGNGKSIKQDEIVKGGWPDPIDIEISKDANNLIPAKFRKNIVTEKTTKKIQNVPESIDLSNDVTAISYKKETPDRYEQVTIKETIDNNTSELNGTEYGDIVTRIVSEKIVNDGEAPDTGLDIISSIVEPLGNGKSIKQTKRAKNGWPDPLEKQISKDGSYLPPARYRKDLTQTRITRKIPTDQIPDSPSLSGSETAKSYKKETPDRAEESVTNETFELNVNAVDESIEQKPFIKITSRMTPGPTSVLPKVGNGSSKLVYEGATTDIYENVKEIAEPKEGPAGSEKNTKPFVSIVNNKRYSTSNEIGTISGSADIVFDDGNVTVYQITETDSTGRYGPAGIEQQVKPFVKITTEASYEPYGYLDQGEVGNSNKIYDDGETVVYEKKVETSVARTGPAGIEQQVKPFVKITTESSYDQDGLLEEGQVGGSNKIFDDGNTIVYEKKIETAAVVESEAGVEKEIKPFVEITTQKRYSSSPTINTPTGTAQVIFNDGNVQAYEISESTSQIRAGLKSVEQDPQPWGHVIEATNYTAFSSPGDGGGSRLVYDDGSIKVYESSQVSEIVANGTSKERDPKEWGELKWSGIFSETEDESAERTKQVYNRGTFKVFHNETASIKINTTKFVSAREENSLLIETQYTQYGETPIEGLNKRSRVVFILNDFKVYENIEIVREPKSMRTYPSVVNVDLPPVHLYTEITNYNRWDGQFKVCYTPRMLAGYRGPMACTVEENWQQDPNIDITPTVLKPQAMLFDFPAGGGYSVGPCLHGSVEERETINFGHPVYPFQTNKISYAATEPRTWVGMRLLAHVDSQPYRDGFVIRKYYVQL